MEKRESPIHGTGIFVTEGVKKGDIFYQGMTWHEFKKIYGENNDKNKNNNRYLRRVWKIIVATEKPFQNYDLVNCIKESSEPNVVLKKRRLYALKDINKDEELFLFKEL